MPDMIASPLNPTFAPVAGGLIAITASVSSSASNSITPMGFRGLFFRSTSSVTFRTLNDVDVTLSDVQPNVQIWIAGKFVMAIATATNVFAMI